MERRQNGFGIHFFGPSVEGGTLHPIFGGGGSHENDPDENEGDDDDRDRDDESENDHDENENGNEDDDDHDDETENENDHDENENEEDDDDHRPGHAQQKVPTLRILLYPKYKSMVCEHEHQNITVSFLYSVMIDFANTFLQHFVRTYCFETPHFQRSNSCTLGGSTL